MLASSRDLIDWGVRGRVAAIPNVRIRQGVAVAGLILGPGGAGVAGVRLRPRPSGHGADRGRTELAADLVVVADGRNSRLPDWLTALGYEPPPETVVNSFQGYASRRYRPAAGFKADWKELYIQQAPPDDPRGGLVVPIEGGLWLVSLKGMTTAALGAEALDRWLRGESWRRGRVFQHALARATATAWQLSTGADYGFRTTEGSPEEWVARLTVRYLAEVMRTGTRRPWVRRRLAEVFHMLRPPSALFGPGVLARLACDRLAGVTGADRRRVGYPREGSDGGPRPHRRPTADLDVACDLAGRG